MRNTSSYRVRRVNEALKEIIGTALTQEIKDPRIGFVTLTGVDTAPDFAHAKVFVSVYGKQAEKDATMEGLRAARPYLQRLISDELDLKRTPMLEFVYDVSVDQGMHIQAMLKASGVADLPPAEIEGSADGLATSGEPGESGDSEARVEDEEGEAAEHGGERGE
jgi:ribosome-binding factor A